MAHIKDVMDEDHGLRLGSLYTTSTQDVIDVLANKVDPNGRSEWQWLVFANGDIALITFPQGDLFEKLTQVRGIAR